MPLPTVILPGYLAGYLDYQDLETDLNKQGIPTVTVPIRKRDWLPTIGGRSLVPIIRIIDQTVKQTLAEFNVSKVNLIGHSAGGWVSRIYLGEKPYLDGVWNARNFVSTLVTLGTPHISQERWTKRNLDFIKDNYPGAFYPEVKYICVAGKAIFGQRKLGSWFAYNSYQLTCGKGDCWGDGITPVTAAHLDGAINLTLENVMHSPKSPGIWYGSKEVQKHWVGYLINN